MPSNKTDVRRNVLNNDKLNRLIGKYQFLSLREGIIEMWKELTKHEGDV